MFFCELDQLRRLSQKKILLAQYSFLCTLWKLANTVSALASYSSFCFPRPEIQQLYLSPVQELRGVSLTHSYVHSNHVAYYQFIITWGIMQATLHKLRLRDQENFCMLLKVQRRASRKQKIIKHVGFWPRQ